MAAPDLVRAAVEGRLPRGIGVERAGNGISGCRDRAQKIASRDRECPQRPRTRNETGENPRRNGLFPIDDGWRGLGRLDGGVRSRMRTRLPVICPISGCFSKITANWRPKLSKRPAAQAFL